MKCGNPKLGITKTASAEKCLAVTLTLEVFNHLLTITASRPFIGYIIVRESKCEMMNDREIRILLIEDDEDDYLLTSEMLSDTYSKRFRLDWASSFQDGLAMMTATDYDIYLVDYRLGAHSGLDLAQAAVSVGDDTPIVLLTGQSSRDVDLAAMETGVADYLIKGEVTGSMLERSIRYALERHRNEEQLRLQARMLEVTANAIVITDADGIISWVNPAFTKLTGYTTAEAVGQNPRILKSGVQDQAVYDEMWQTIGNGDVWQGEIINKRKCGRLYVEEMTITPVVGAGGEINQFIATKQDISERKMAEDSLRESETRYRSVFETAQDALIIVDINGAIKDVNPKTCEMYGYDYKELIGQSALRLIHPDDHYQLEVFVERVTTGESFQGNTIDLRKDGSTFYTDIRGSFYTVGDEPLLLAVIRDITEEKLIRQAEQEQRVLAEALRQTAEIMGSTLDFDEILDAILGSIERVVPHDATSFLWVEDGYTQVIRQRGFETRGLEKWITEQQLKLSEVEDIRKLIATQQPVLIPDTQADPDWVTYDQTRWIRSHVLIPVLLNGEVACILDLVSAMPGHFTTEQIPPLQGFANQVSVALQNAQHYQEAVTAAERRATLHQVSQEIVAASRTPESVYYAVHRAATKLMPCEAFAIANTNGQAGRLQAVYLFDKGGRYPTTSIDEEASLSSKVIKIGRSILIEDLAQEADFEVAYFGDKDHVRSILAVPMQVNGKTSGVIAAQSYQAHAYTLEDQHLLEMLAAHASSALESSQLFLEVQKHADQQETLNEITRTALAADDFEVAIKILAARLKDLFQADACFMTLWDEDLQQPRPGAVAGFDAQEYLSVGVQPDEPTVTQHALEINQTIIIADTSQSPYLSPRIAGLFPSRSLLALPFIANEKKLGAALIAFNEIHDFTTEEVQLGENAAAQVSLALAKMRLLEETHQRALELEVMAEVSTALRVANSRDEMGTVILDQLMHLLDAEGAALVKNEANAQEIILEFAAGEFTEVKGLKLSPKNSVTGQVLETGQPYVTKDFQQDPLTQHKELVDEPLTAAWAPLIAQDKVIGALIVCRNRNGKNGNADFTDLQLRLLTAVGDAAANALHRIELFERTQQQLARLTALHEIDMSISASFDLNLPFNTVLDKIITQLNVDAAAILLLDRAPNRLEHAASRGFWTTRILDTSLSLGEPHAGLAALERQPIFIENLSEDTFIRDHYLIKEEGFVCFYAIPLMSKGKVNGVLELFNRTPVTRTPEWFDFIKTLATQASIAINNSELYTEAQRSNMELSLAYDATIEGWAKTLELRDMETEGHCRRVTEMTLRLAQAMQVNPAELVHIRRGAFLHDIGKMGIPDAILFKPGKLSPAEWDEMKQHPVYAHKLLSAISFLRPALDIPHYHHEKWDGTGYPRGLAGEQIPLAARIFAIVDVWDALSSDRPYRKAWPREKVIAYIKEQAGTHFDPQVVEAFIGIVETVAN